MKLIPTKVLLLIIVCLSMSVAEGSGDVSVSGITITNDLAIMALDCTANTNGGALTTDEFGVVVCSDDDSATAGPAGPSGKTVLNGNGVPSNVSDGVDGDFYIDTAADAIYGPKTGGDWGRATSLVGPSGPAGTDGAQGAPGVSGLTWPPNTQIFSNSISGGGSALMIISCSPGKKVLSGGCEHTNDRMNITANRPNDAESWMCRLQNPTLSILSVTLTGYAYCAFVN